MVVRNNASLADLSGLSGITSVGTWLELGQLPALTTPDALSGLISIGTTLSLQYNSQLPDCRACQLLGQLTAQPTNIYVTNNLADSRTPVPASCP